MESETFNKAGYLKDNFRLFHLTDTNSLPISYHYHDFYKVFLLLRGDVTYHIEGKTYDLKPYDLVLVNAGEIHKPVINSTFYERMILYISPDFLERYKESGDLLDSCFTTSKWPRYCSNSTFCKREKCINNTLSCYQWHIRR